MRRHAGVLQVFDALRRKWLALTPEEWVRQHVVGFLIHEKKVPAGLISLEKALRLNDLKKRYDVVVFDHTLKPWLIVECKSPSLPVSPAVLAQVAVYNSTLKAAYICITNGLVHLCAKIDWEQRKTTQVDEAPAFPD